MHQARRRQRRVRNPVKNIRWNVLRKKLSSITAKLSILDVGRILNMLLGDCIFPKFSVTPEYFSGLSQKNFVI